MNTGTMDNSLKNAYALAPLSNEKKTDDSLARMLADGSQQNSEEASNSSLLDQLFSSDMFAGMPGNMALDALPIASQQPTATSQQNCCSPYDISTPAKRFQGLGVDPNNFQLASQRDEMTFKLAMEQEDMTVGAEGGVNYRESSMALQIKMSSEKGYANVDGKQVMFEKVSFSIDFAWSQTTMGEGAAEGAQGGNPLANFANNKEKFAELIKGAIDELSKIGTGEGGIEGDADALMAFGAKLAEDLFSLMTGVMEVGAQDNSRGLYGPPKPGAQNEDKLAKMQQVADDLTAQTEALAEDLAAREAEVPVADEEVTIMDLVDDAAPEAVEPDEMQKMEADNTEALIAAAAPAPVEDVKAEPVKAEGDDKKAFAAHKIPPSPERLAHTWKPFANNGNHNGAAKALNLVA
jgi:hypothetical protein